jgi:hypothetical protein
MKCAINNKGIQKDNSFEKGLNSGIDIMLTLFAYTLSKYGYKGKRIQQMVDTVTYAADSVTRGYVTIKDFEDILFDEYGIEMRKRKEWLQRSDKDELRRIS